MLRLTFTILIGIPLTALRAAAFEPGEKVVIIRPANLKTTTGSSVALTPGTSATVQSVEERRLNVAAGRLGSIDPAAVIAAYKADAYFSARIGNDAQDAAALLARGKMRFEKGDVDQAIADLDQSLKLVPSSEAWTFRAFASKRKGDKDQALSGFGEAIKLNPKNALAWRVRGATWAGKADYPKALADYSESIRIDPDNPDSLHHRAIMLGACNDAQIRNGPQAVKDATRACEVSGWKNPLYLTGLAIAYAETGDFNSAIQWETKAIELSSKNAVSSRNAQLDLYRQHKPFRMTWR